MPLLNTQCDYHMHSTASDGSLSPTQLVTLAAQQGLQELALTDHDTFNGLAEAQQTATQLGLRLITGMEMSCVWQGVTVHLVALWPQGLNAAAQALAQAQEQARWQRAHTLVERLAKTPAPVSLEQVLEHSAGGVPGRPHFAAAMVAAGYATNPSQAFRKWLGNGKVGDVKSSWPDLTAAVTALLQAQAFISLAHPNYYNLTRSKRKRLIHAFASAGGQGLEVVNGKQDPQLTLSLVRMALELNLHPTWGSDFHHPGIISPHPGAYAPLPEACIPLSLVLNF